MLSIEIAIGIGPPHHFKEGILGPFFGRSRGDNLLGQNVEWLFRKLKPIKFAATDCVYYRSTFNQLIAR